jgi:hypothetical protein
MKRWPVVALLIALAAPAAAQPAAPPADWKAWSALVGAEWIGEGGPAGATGAFTFAPALQGRVLERRNYASYPAAGGRPASRHDDYMIVYQQGAATRADYYDNEGHVIRYVVTVDPGKRYQFLSEPAAGQPRFRLTYTIDKPGALALVFEIAPPGSDTFKPYITARAHQASAAPKPAQ